jgi:hypothetical protein
MSHRFSSDPRALLGVEMQTNPLSGLKAFTPSVSPCSEMARWRKGTRFCPTFSARSRADVTGHTQGTPAMVTRTGSSGVGLCASNQSLRCARQSRQNGWCPSAIGATRGIRRAVASIITVSLIVRPPCQDTTLTVRQRAASARVRTQEINQAGKRRIRRE